MKSNKFCINYVIFSLYGVIVCRVVEEEGDSHIEWEIISHPLFTDLNISVISH